MKIEIQVVSLEIAEEVWKIANPEKVGKIWHFFGYTDNFDEVDDKIKKKYLLIATAVQKMIVEAERKGRIDEVEKTIKMLKIYGVSQIYLDVLNGRITKLKQEK